MKKILMSAAVLALALASCQNEEVVSQADGMVTVKAVMGINSRTTVSEGGDVTWSKGDKMLVYGGETEGVLTLEGDGGSEDGIFTGFVQGSVSELTTALYPAEMASSDGTITLSQVTYPNSNSPMVAEWSTGAMQFSHLAGMLRISVTGLPNNTNTLKISGTGIAGTATLNNGKLTDFSTGNETIVVKGIPTGDQVIDVPVFATETLKEVTLKVSVNNGTAKEIKAAIGIGAMQCVYLTLGANGDLAETDTYTGWYDESKTEFTLRTAEELKGLAALVNTGNAFAGKTITLDSDIDLEGVEWTPIGTQTGVKYFDGTFDGGNHTIANLKCEKSQEGVGLFGAVKSGSVKNVVITDAEIVGKKYVGGIVGFTPHGSENAVIENCKVIGSKIICTPEEDGDHGKYVGSFIGSAQGGKLLGCYAEGVMLTAYEGIGAVAGRSTGGAQMIGNIVNNILIVQDNKFNRGNYVNELIGREQSAGIDNVSENVKIVLGVVKLEVDSEIYKNNEEGKYYVFTEEDFEYLVSEGIAEENINLISL